jgi:hypothetical protein
MSTVTFRISPANIKDIYPAYVTYMGMESPEYAPYGGDGKVWLIARVLYAIDNKIAFIGGNLDFPLANYNRSVLLRTTDGGLQWTEVLSTTILSQVERVVFLSEGEGWAYIDGIDELGSIMPSMLWHTTDYGLSWALVKNKAYEAPTDYASYDDLPPCIIHEVRSLRFFNSQNGELSEVCRNGGSIDYFAILATENGGQTWHTSFYLPLAPSIEGDYEDKQLLAAFEIPVGGRYGSHSGFCLPYSDGECRAYGQDGSIWKILDSEEQNRLTISHRMPGEGDWTYYQFTDCFEIQQGIMLGSCKSTP